MEYLDTGNPVGFQIEPQIVSEHGIDAECVVYCHAKENPGEQKPGPLESVNTDPQANKPGSKKGGHPIKDRHVEYLWLAEALNRRALHTLLCGVVLNYL